MKIHGYNKCFGERPEQDHKYRSLFWLYIGMNEDLMIGQAHISSRNRFGPDECTSIHWAAIDRVNTNDPAFSQPLAEALTFITRSLCSAS